MPNELHLPSSPVTTATGIIAIDQQVWTISIRSELAILDARSWMRFIADRHRVMAAEGRKDGDLSFASEMEEVADQLVEMVRANRYIDCDGMWPHLAGRARVQPWDVTAFQDVRRYAANLVEMHDPALADADLQFVLRIGDEIAELLVTPALRTAARFCGEVVQSKILDPYELAWVAETLAA